MYHNNHGWYESMTGRKGVWLAYKTGMGWNNKCWNQQYASKTVGSKREYYERYIINKLHQKQQLKKITSIKKDIIILIEDIFNRNKENILDKCCIFDKINIDNLLDDDIIN